MNLHTARFYGEVIHDPVETLNVLAEKKEKRPKDERKKLR